MEVLDYLDFGAIFKKVKDNHLKEFPTAESYMKLLEGFEGDCSHVEAMYRYLNNPPEDAEFPTSESKFDNEVFDFANNRIIIELCIGGNDANESTNHNEWGYGWEFTIDLEEEIFVDFSEHNYS